MKKTTKKAATKKTADKKKQPVRAVLVKNLEDMRDELVARVKHLHKSRIMELKSRPANAPQAYDRARSIDQLELETDLAQDWIAALESAINDSFELPEAPVSVFGGPLEPAPFMLGSRSS